MGQTQTVQQFFCASVGRSRGSEHHGIDPNISGHHDCSTKAVFLCTAEKLQCWPMLAHNDTYWRVLAFSFLHISFIGQRCQIHQKQEWSTEFCCSCFRVQMHKPLVHASQRASIYHQGTEASLLELRRFMTLRGLGFPDSPNTTGWPPLVVQGLAPMDQLSKSRTKTNLQAKYRTPQMPLAARHWFSEGSKSRSQ